MKKKLSILFLCFVLVFANMMPVYASGDAGNSVEEVVDSHQTAETVQGSATLVNPVYEGLLTEADLLTVEDVEAPIMMLAEEDPYTSPQDAGVYLRQQMKNRVQTVSFSYSEALDFDPNDEEAFDAYLEELQTELLAVAMAHTGDPSEGDFLQFQYGGSSCSASASYSNGQWYLTGCTFVITYYTTLEQEEELTEAIDLLLAELNLSDMNDYDKVKAIYDYVCENVVYDYTNLNNDSYKLKYTAYAALINGTSVCQGYANLMYRLLMEAGLDTRIISGTSNGENHGWNIVQLNDYYYNLDATWDAPRAQADQEYKYFLKCDTSYGDHVRDAAYTTGTFGINYPMGVSDYDPSEGDSDDDSQRDPVTEAGSLTLNNPTTAVIPDAFDPVLYTFTPAVSGQYGFYSVDSLDARATLYKGNPNGDAYSYLTESDDGFENSIEFFIRYDLQAGVAYYLEATSYYEEKYKIVVEKLAPAEGISIEGSASLSAFVGMEDWLNYKLTPERCMEESVFWTSSDETIVSIDNAGYYKCLKVGTVTITASTESGISDTIQMIVSDPSEAPALTLDKSEELTVSEYSEKQMYQFTPATTGVYVFYSTGQAMPIVTLYDEDMEYITSDTYSGVDDNFLLIEKLEAGKTYYYEVEPDGETGDEFDVVLTAPEFTSVSKGEKKSSTVTVAEGYEYYVFEYADEKDYEVYLETEEDSDVIYISYNIDDKYYIAVIGSSASDEDYTMWVDELVAATAIKVSFDDESDNYFDSFIGYVGDTGRFYGAYEPYNAVFEYYSWESDDSDTVSIDVPGYFELLQKGTTTLTVTSENGLTKTLPVTVLELSDAETLVVGTPKHTTLNENCNHVFYQFTPDESGLYQLSVKNGTDAYMVLYDTGEEFPESGEPFNSETLQVLTSGNTYYLEIGTYETDIQNVDVSVENIDVTDLSEIGKVEDVSIKAGEEHFYCYKTVEGNEYYPSWTSKNDALIVDTSFIDDFYYMKVICLYDSEDVYSLEVVEECPATGIQIIDGDKLTGYVGHEVTLESELLPENAISELQTWTSSNSEVVSVEDGHCEFKKAGTAIVTVTCDSGFSDSIDITVKDIIYTPLDLGVEVSATSASDSDIYGYSFTAPEAGVYNVSLACDDHWAEIRLFNDSIDYKTNLYELDKQVELDEGETIYLDVWFETKLEVDYDVKIEKLVPATSMNIFSGEYGFVGHEETLKVFFNPSDAIEESVEWISDNTEVATVDSDGNVTFLSPGTVMITATSENGLTSSVTITVKDVVYQELVLETPVQGTLETRAEMDGYIFTVPKDGRYRVTLSASESVQFFETIEDETYSHFVKNMRMEEDLYAGEEYKYSLYCESTSVTYEIKIIELVQATGMYIPSGDTADAYVGDIGMLDTVYTPENAASELATWTSSDSSIAEVEGHWVWFLKEGTVVLTATSDSGLKDSVTVTVHDTDVYTEIKANEDVQITVDIGETSNLFKFVPESTGVYAFYSDAEDIDPYGYLLDEDFNQINENDDYSEYDFALAHWLEAGKTYYFKTTSYDDTTGTYTMHVEKVDVIKIGQQISESAKVHQPYFYAFEVPCDGEYKVSITAESSFELEIGNIETMDESKIIPVEEGELVENYVWTAGDWICFIGLMLEDSADFTLCIQPTEDVTHEAELVNVKEATCTAEGYTGDQICKHCGTILAKGTAIAKKAHVTELKNAKEATCAAEGYTGDQICKNCSATVTKGTAIAKKAHVTELKNAKEATCTAEGYTGDQICKNCSATVIKGTAIAKKAHVTELKNVKEATCTAEGYTGDQICKNCKATVTKGTAIAKKAHSWDMGLITTEPTLAKLGVKTYACTVCKTTKTENVEFTGVVRISGKDRYLTSIAIADQLKDVLGVAKFDTIIIASGTNFPDALAGSYLAAEKNAPILMTNGKSKIEELYAYIDKNFNSKGQIYILGGTAAVPDNVLNTLKSKGYKVERLSGKGRYDTNIAILKAAGTKGKEILVCTGTGFADSLSASAADLPIFLVNGKGTLSKEQKEYLATIKGSNFCIVGGTGVVSTSIEEELEVYGTVERVSGKGRYETSVAFAKRYFKSPDTALVAYAWNYPDGLCGGPLAAKLQAPLILTGADKTNGKKPTTAQEATAASAAETYVNTYKIKKGVALGGTGVLTDYTVNTIFDLK